MKFSFFGSVRNDWDLVRNLINTIESIFWFVPKEIVLIDDCSRTNEVDYARFLGKENPNLSIGFNSQHEGIVPCLNQAIDRLSGDIALPIAADMEYVSGFLPLVLLYAFEVVGADFFFAKARHVDQHSMKTVGITGWSAKKGEQQKHKSVENFISGQTRPSGSAAAFRTELLKQYRYDKNLASLSDYYLNNLMILKHKSFYYGKVASKTLERKASYSNSFNREQSLALIEKTVTKLESDGVILTDAQKKRYQEYERSQWQH
jgi:glycosyltransferase involved in cell wall biosynthesis